MKDYDFDQNEVNIDTKVQVDGNILMLKGNNNTAINMVTGEIIAEEIMVSSCKTYYTDGLNNDASYTVMTYFKDKIYHLIVLDSEGKSIFDEQQCNDATMIDDNLVYCKNEKNNKYIVSTNLATGKDNYKYDYSDKYVFSYSNNLIMCASTDYEAREDKLYIRNIHTGEKIAEYDHTIKPAAFISDDYYVIAKTNKNDEYTGYSICDIKGSVLKEGTLQSDIPRLLVKFNTGKDEAFVSVSSNNKEYVIDLENDNTYEIACNWDLSYTYKGYMFIASDNDLKVYNEKKECVFTIKNDELSYPRYKNVLITNNGIISYIDKSQRIHSYDINTKEDKILYEGSQYMMVEGILVDDKYSVFIDDKKVGMIDVTKENYISLAEGTYSFNLLYCSDAGIVIVGEGDVSNPENVKIYKFERK